MYAFILAVALSAQPSEPTDVKVCKIDRVRSPVKAGKIPRIRCVLAKNDRIQGDTLTRTMDFAADEKR